MLQGMKRDGLIATWAKSTRKQCGGGAGEESRGHSQSRPAQAFNTCALEAEAGRSP